MNKIDIQLILQPEGKLISVYDQNLIDRNIREHLHDNSNKYISVEFLKYKNKCLYDTVIFKTNDTLSNSEFALLNDGLYEYNFYLIPTLEYLLIETDKYDADNNMLYNEVCIANQLFYYGGNVYKSNYREDLKSSEYVTAEMFINKYVDDILKNSIKLNIKDLEALDDFGLSTYFCKKIIFTYCNLIKCFVSLQSNLANNICDSSCGKSDTIDTSNRDFLLSTIYVLDYLRDTNNFREAERILDNINECGGFCKSETLTKCNCCG